MRATLFDLFDDLFPVQKTVWRVYINYSSTQCIRRVFDSYEGAMDYAERLTRNIADGYVSWVEVPTGLMRADAVRNLEVARSTVTVPRKNPYLEAQGASR